MKSQIPAAAAAYFELRRVDLSEHHPVVSATFTPGQGWQPVLVPYRVSHMRLVFLREAGVTEVQLTAEDAQGNVRIPDFSIDSLIGDMGALDAEFTDGIPVSEGSGAVGSVNQIRTILNEIGVTDEGIKELLTKAALYEKVEFSVARRDSYDYTLHEEIRYRLTPHGKTNEGEFAYELTVLVHEEAKS